MEVCSLHLHFVLQYSLLIWSKTYSENVYLVLIEFDLPLLYLDIELIVNVVLHIHRLLIGLAHFLLCFRRPTEGRHLRVYVVWVRVTILVQDVLGFTWPLSVCILMVNLVL
jgi:hypothetical protein